MVIEIDTPVPRHANPPPTVVKAPVSKQENASSIDTHNYQVKKGKRMCVSCQKTKKKECHIFVGAEDVLVTWAEKLVKGDKVALDRPPTLPACPV